MEGRYKYLGIYLSGQTYNRTKNLEIKKHAAADRDTDFSLQENKQKELSTRYTTKNDPTPT